MRSFIALLKLSFIQTLTSIVKIGHKKKTMGSVIVIIFLGSVFLYLSGSFSFKIAAVLAPVEALDIMLIGVAILRIIMAIVFSILSAQSTIFATKDLDFIMSMPVSAFKIMLARLFSLSLDVLLTIELFLLPAGVAWLYFDGGGGLFFISRLIFSGIWLAFIPTLIALVFGGLISLLVSKLPQKNLFISLFSILFYAGAITGSFYLSAITETMVENSNAIRVLLIETIRPAGWFISFVVNGQLPAIAQLTAVGLFPSLLLCWIFSKLYKKLLTLLSSHDLKSDYKLRSIPASSSYLALLRKELSKFLGTPIYLMNCGTGILMLLIISVAALIFKSNIDIYVWAINEEAPDVIPGIILLLVGFYIGTGSTSAVSISLEGNNLWILKEAPLSYNKIFAAKCGFNFLLSSVGIIVCIPMLGYSLSLSIIDTVSLMLIEFFVAWLFAMQGLFINLLFPQLNAENDTRVVKHSASVFVQMLSVLIEIFLLGLLYYCLLAAGHGFYVFVLITIPILMIINLFFLKLLNIKGQKLFAAL